MQNLRISEKNKVSSDIKSKEILIKRNTETIERLKSQEQSKFNSTQIEKLLKHNVSIEKDIELLKNRLSSIQSGNIDTEMMDNMKKVKSDIHKKEEIKNKKIQEQEEHKKKGKDNLHIYYKNTNDYSDNNVDKQFERWCNITPPSYMIENLKDMPSNKGYIWKGKKFYGEKKATSKDEIMFEKLKGGVLNIIETTTKGYYRYRTVYEKIGKNQKKLISKEEIPRYTFGFSIDKNDNLMVLDNFGNLIKN